MNRAFRESIANGEPLDDAMVAVSVSDALASVGRELKNLEATRHRSRTAVFAVGFAEGVSVGKLGRLYGFSRQLAQRFAKEARDQRGRTSELLVRAIVSGFHSADGFRGDYCCCATFVVKSSHRGCRCVLQVNGRDLSMRLGTEIDTCRNSLWAWKRVPAHAAPGSSPLASMKRRWSHNVTKRMKIVSAVCGILLVGVTAYAATNWVVGLNSGSSAEGQSATIANLSMSAVASPSATNLLYPGEPATWWSQSPTRTPTRSRSRRCCSRPAPPTPRATPRARAPPPRLGVSPRRRVMSSGTSRRRRVGALHAHHASRRRRQWSAEQPARGHLHQRRIHDRSRPSGVCLHLLFNALVDRDHGDGWLGYTDDQPRH